MGAATSNINTVPPCYGSVADGGGTNGANCVGGGGNGAVGGSNSSANNGEADGSLRLPAFVSRKTRSVSTLSGASCGGFLSSSHCSSPIHTPVTTTGGGGSSSTQAPSGSSKSAKLSTLRKKMSRFRRKSNIATDYSKQMREFIASWSYRELLSLRQEYEALSTLKDLTIQAGSARASSRSIKTDLSNLFESQLCADAQLVYHGALFPVHRAILCSRCAVFKSLFASIPSIDFSSPIPVEIRTPGINLTMFACLLKYLYTGQISMEEARLDNWETLSLLCEEFGTPNLLEQDLKRLLDSSAYSDCVLVFSSPNFDECIYGIRRHPVTSISPSTSSTCSSNASPNSPHCARYRPQVSRNFEMRCHRSILAARSKFFQNLILRRDSSESVLRIVLDESIIPRKFALVLLHAFYTDKLDITLLLRPDVNNSCGGLVRHPIATLVANFSNAHTSGCGSVNGKRDSYSSAYNFSSSSGTTLGPSGGHTCSQYNSSSMTSLLFEVMELYYIGQFLEFDALSQACEDFMAEHLSVETLVPLLRWSAQPHGSDWIHRQALHFLHEEFLQISHSHVLFDLNKNELTAALQSPFLQSPESEVLSAVIRWGEHELLRLMDERVPNILSHTTPSNQPKKSAHAKRIKELDNVELAELLGDTLQLVRLQHVLPAGQSELVQSSIRRELIRSPPTLYLVQASPADFVHCWIRGAPPPSASPQPPNSSGSRSCRGGLNYGHSSHNASGSHCQGHSYLSVVGHGTASPPPPVQFIPPRLFMPFYEEVKALLNEQFRSCKAPSEPSGFFSPRPPTRQPLDLLAGSAALSMRGNTAGASSGSGFSGYCLDPEAMAAVSPLNVRVLESVRKRAREMEQQLVVQRAFLMPCADRPAVLRQLQLRALREAGLPDSALDIVFSQSERQHGLVAAAAAAASAVMADDMPVIHRGHQSCTPQHGAVSYGPATSRTATNSGLPHGMPVDYGAPAHTQPGHHSSHIMSRFNDHGRYSPAAMVTLPPLMTASWSDGIGGGANFPPDVTLPHPANSNHQRASTTGPATQTKRDQATSSDEYEDTACIL